MDFYWIWEAGMVIITTIFLCNHTFMEGPSNILLHPRIWPVVKYLFVGSNRRHTPLKPFSSWSLCFSPGRFDDYHTTRQSTCKVYEGVIRLAVGWRFWHIFVLRGFCNHINIAGVSRKKIFQMGYHCKEKRLGILLILSIIWNSDKQVKQSWFKKQVRFVFWNLLQNLSQFLPAATAFTRR